MYNRIRRFAGDRSGATAIVVVLLLPILLGMSALSIEYGSGLLTRVKNQRAADLASIAGALAYSDTGSEERMRAAAADVAALNGLPGSSIVTTLSSSPRDPDAEAVHVTIKTSNKLVLATVLGIDPSLKIAAQANTAIATESGGCILALDQAGSGITLSGGVRVNAGSCNVASNATITAPCGTRITTEGANYFSESAPADCRWSDNIVKPDGNPAPTSKKYTDDPLAGNEGVATLQARFNEMDKAVWPSKVSVAKRENIHFGWSPLKDRELEALNATDCAATRPDGAWSSHWVVTCTGDEVNLGSITADGGIRIDFNNASSEPPIRKITYNFSGAINTQNAPIAFGPGTFNIMEGVYGANVTFGAGTFHIGRGTTQCGASFYSICNSGTMTFDGPSTFVLDAGIHNGGGAKLSLGAGASNSYIIRSAGNGDAITVSGGSRTHLADATGKDGVYRVGGNVNGSGGGSCLVFPAAEQHDISGNVHLAGGAKLGAGIYTIDGYFKIDTGGANCSDWPGAIYGKDVNIIISGKTTPSDWSCRERAFCISGGNSVTLLAPVSGALAKLAVIGPQSPDVTSGAMIDAGGKARISGAFYFPNGDVDMHGGGRIEGAEGDCLQLIGASVSLSGGTSATSECVEASGAGNIALIQ
ncbi:pilus assembly protein TadG-related protein [Nitratireductor luteus]|uniref:pilus assembly protein TadG-related protein n=1 Tax=Nitratireductor luteus TaxID=2976980 RepID=UPI00223F682C|nr:pilus assembly protein TadG-related protein [Nitratireductor luteus]